MRCASRAIGERVGALALILTASGCGVLAPLEGTPPCADYAAVVQPVLDRDCTSCHGPARAEGGYRLDSRDAGIALRDDGTSRVAGASPSFVAAAQGTLTGHPALTLASEDVTVLATWVTACKAGLGQPLYHQRGWATPGDEAFHGVALRATGYQLAPCQKCHGSDLDGGAAQVSCQSCHAAGVLACQTCHGSASNAAPPRSLSSGRLTSQLGVGAHQSHVVDGPLHLAYGCDACHVPVTDVHQDSHFPQDGGAPDGIAEVQLAGTGAWNRTAATCASTSCHAPAADTAASNQTPVWTTVGQGQAACGTCHGMPPAAPHPQDPACARCHPVNPADGGVLVAAHANGVVNLGHTLPDGGVPGLTAGCGTCHAAGAPFFDTLGRQDTSLPSVGLHGFHLAGTRKLTRSLTCADCHRVPAAIDSPGHLGRGDAVVFPADAGAGTLAWSDGAQPVYDPVAATCTNVYCHGAGTKAAGDSATSRVRTWPWTFGIGLGCDYCHGAPPATPSHATAVGGLTSCNRCHPATIDAQGKLVITTLPDGGVGTTHLDGLIEVSL